MRKGRFLSLTFLTAVMAVLALRYDCPAQELRVFRSQMPYEDDLMRRQLYEHLTGIARGFLQQQDREIQAIQTPEDVAERKNTIRARIMDCIGPFPERSDLKARVTGSFKREGYRVENVLFQSRPGFYVTGNLYIPSSGDKPFPAVLGVNGHTLNGKAGQTYQHIWIGLARKGYVVFTFDPPGQGERMMYWDEARGESVVKGTTPEHTMAGIQCLLTGSNAANYFIWDGIRAIDYLLTRPEVDPKRIAVTGNSGGGMESAYLGAIDDRLAACIPNCYLNSWEQLWTTLGPQDAEQNMLPFVGSSLDFIDYIIPFAPRPYQMNLAIQDFFSIAGARRTYEKARRIYELMGAGDNLRKVEYDAGHGYWQPMREQMYGFLNNRFKGGKDAPDPEPEIQVEADRELQVTPSGQVMTSYPDSRTIGQLNARYAQQVKYKAALPSKESGLAAFRQDIQARVRRMTAILPADAPLDIQYRGSLSQGDILVETLTYQSEPGITIPALLFRPSGTESSLPAVLYAADESKNTDAAGEIASLVKAGYQVLAPDVRGKGESGREIEINEQFAEWFARDWQIAFMALQVKKNLVGMRALDLVRAVDVLLTWERIKVSKVVAVGRGSGCIPLLHAAVLDERIAGLVLDGGLWSWETMINSHLHRGQLDNVILGVYREYDLPLLAASLAPRPLALSNPADALGHMVHPDSVRSGYSQAAACYKLTGAPSMPLVIERPAGVNIAEACAGVLDGKK